MKRQTRSSSPYSYYYYHNLWENCRAEFGESLKKPKKSAKACSKQLAQRDNVTPFCAICDETAKKGKEEEKREVVEENVVVIIDEDEEEKKEVVENKVVENGEVVEEEKSEVVEKKVVEINGDQVVENEKSEVVENKVVENGEVMVEEEKRSEVVEKKVVEDEKRQVVEKKLEENGEVNDGEKGDYEDGKLVIIDSGIEFEALYDGENNAGEGNGDGGVLVGEKKNEDLFSSDIFGELSGWEEWKFEVEQKWECNYPFWEFEDGAHNFWDNVEAHNANDWTESLWQF